MPLPMVHLSVTTRIFELMNQEGNGAILTGCLAPDAIHMRQESNRYDKNLTHIKHREFSNLEDAIECLEKHFEKIFIQFSNIESVTIDYQGKNGFDLGYFIHCLTDYLWYYHVYIDFKKKIIEQHRSDLIKDIYYKEADYIDYLIFERASWRPSVWKKLEINNVLYCNEFVTNEEVSLWIDRTLHWFDDVEETNFQLLEFISMECVDAFIQDAARIIVDLLIKR